VILVALISSIIREGDDRHEFSDSVSRISFRFEEIKHDLMNCHAYSAIHLPSSFSLEMTSSIIIPDAPDPLYLQEYIQ
jgi:hypothetical protein